MAIDWNLRALSVAETIMRSTLLLISERYLEICVVCCSRE